MSGYFGIMSTWSAPSNRR